MKLSVGKRLYLGFSIISLIVLLLGFYAVVQEARERLYHISTEHWLHYDLFSLKWWVLLFLAIAPWFLWWKLVDKTRLPKILIYGLLFACFSVTFDIFGTTSLLYSYPIKLFPFTPPLLPYDFTVLPVTYMLVYQYVPGKNFWYVCLALAGFLAFIMEPLLVLTRFYELISWKYIYSFPIYLSMSLLFRWLTENITAKS